MLDGIVSVVAPELPNGAPVLDAGCGTGNLAVRLAQKGWEVTAIDGAEGMLDRARGKRSPVRFSQADLNAPLAYADGSFAAVTCSNVLYSLQNREVFLAEAARVLRPGGRLVLTNPRSTFSMKSILVQHWQSSDWKDRIVFLLGLPRLATLIGFNMLLLKPEQRARLFFPSAEELGDLMQRSGWQQVRVRGCYAGQGWQVEAVRPQPTSG